MSKLNVTATAVKEARMILEKLPTRRVWLWSAAIALPLGVWKLPDILTAIAALH